MRCFYADANSIYGNSRFTSEMSRINAFNGVLLFTTLRTEQNSIVQYYTAQLFTQRNIMQRVSIAVNALIPRKQFRLKRAPKVAKTGRQTMKLSQL